MVILQEGTTVRIIAPYTDEYGILAVLPETLEVDDDQWDPDLRILYTDVMLEFQPREIEYQMVDTGLVEDLAVPMDARWPYVRRSDHAQGAGATTDLGETDTVVATVMPVVAGALGWIHGTFGGTILVDGILHPAMMQPGIDNTLPMAISKDMWNHLGYTSDGFVVGGTGPDNVPDIDILARYLVPMYNYGYRFSSTGFYMSPIDQYRLVQEDKDIIYAFLPNLKPSVYITEVLTDTKTLANGLIHGGDQVEDLHRLLHTMPPYMAWFFMPSGWYHYGWQTDHQWLLTMDTLRIPSIHRLNHLLLGIVNNVSASGTAIHSGGWDKYNLPTNIRRALATVNASGDGQVPRIVVAGDLVSARDNGYDFYILNNDVDAMTELKYLLGPIDARYHYGRDSILYVLYSMDMSHQMIAHDGRQYHITPEFMTFTSAGLSLMVSPMVSSKDISSTELGVVYLHAGYSTHVVNPTHHTLTMGRDIEDLSTLQYYISGNGINHGAIPPEDDTLYYVEYIEENLSLIREVLLGTPLV